MGVVVAFGLGVLIGAFGAFGAGRRYDRAARASLIASEHFAAARHLAGQAVGGVLLVVLVAGAAALLIWAGS